MSSISFTDSTAVIRDDDGVPRQFTNCTIRLTEQQSADVGDYINRFGLHDRTIDFILSKIFTTGLMEIKAQTDLDRYLDEQDVSE